MIKNINVDQICENCNACIESDIGDCICLESERYTNSNHSVYKIVIENNKRTEDYLWCKGKQFEPEKFE